MVTHFELNGAPATVEGEPEMPLLWALRDLLSLTGTKFGCGLGLCGACTIHVDGAAERSCQLTLEDVEGAKITTIEGLAPTEMMSAVQQAWIAAQVPQCGYCQSGMVMAAEAFLAQNPDPSVEDIDEAITNVCRCGTYPRVRTAILDAAARKRQEEAS